MCSVLGLLAIVTLTGCDALDDVLAVNLPGQVLTGSLDDPELAPVLALSAQAEFECAFVGHYYLTGLWASEMDYGGNQIQAIRYSIRDFQAARYSNAECDFNNQGRENIWRPMQQARRLAADGIHRVLNNMPQGSVENQDLVLAQLYAYEGYATQLIAEPFCGFVDGGDRTVISREDAFRRAEDRFAAAIGHAEQATGTQARDILNMALIGRARARLNLGNGPGALADAERVDEGYVRYATYDQVPNRRRNWVETYNGTGSTSWIVHERDYPVDHPWEVGQRGTTWTVDGVPDPRLEIEYLGGHPNGPPFWYAQRKWVSHDQDLPFASWREAQLMIAEVAGGQRAVGIINTLRDTHGLPHFSSTDEIEIRDQVREERRRELFLLGYRIGDDLRWGTHVDWPTGRNAQQQPYGDEICIPVPELELL